MRIQIVLITVFIVIVVLYIVRVFVLNHLNEFNPEYVRIMDRVQEVRKENKLLKEEILFKTSLFYIYRKAKEQGMIDASFVVIGSEK